MHHLIPSTDTLVRNSKVAEVFAEHRGFSRKKGGFWLMKTVSFLSDAIESYVKYRKGFRT